MLQFNSNRCKTREINDKADDYYSYALRYDPDCYVTQEMCKKPVHNYVSSLLHVSNCYKTQKMCKKLLILVLLS